jgi:hypothetical protein
MSQDPKSQIAPREDFGAASTRSSGTGDHRPDGKIAAPPSPAPPSTAAPRTKTQERLPNSKGTDASKGG